MSFESIYRGYASLGLRLSILDQIRAWLIDHACHKVELAYEGEPVGRPRKPARRGPPRLAPYRPDAYERCFFELRCIHCETGVRSTQSELMIPFDEEVSGGPLASFEERVLDAEPDNFYRTSGLLDPQSTEFDAIRAFLRRHGSHRLRARSVVGETWAAVADAPRHPVQTPSTHGEPHCSASRVVPAYVKESQSYRHWAVESRTGRKEIVAEDAPSVETFVSPGEFIGARWRPGGKLVESVGRFAVGPPLRTVWEIEVPSDLMRGTLGGVVAFDGQRVFASWGATVLALEAGTGRELWRADLRPHGRHWGAGDYLQLSTSGSALVYGLIGGLHVLSAETGAAIWSRTGGEVNAYRAHYGDSLYLAGHHALGGSELEHVCLVLALPTGTERCRTDPNSTGWRKAPLPRPRFTTVPRPTEELVYLGDMDGRLWALSSDTADPVWMHGLRGARSGIERLVIADDRLFALLFDGTLYCLVPS